MAREPLHDLDRLAGEKLFDQLQVIWRIHHPRIEPGGGEPIYRSGGPANTPRIVPYERGLPAFNATNRRSRSTRAAASADRAARPAA